jgi:hypothetical protein
MSDFEGRVAEVLRSEAESAPDALGLADAARGRARARRRTRITAAGLTAVLALAVPVAIVALTSGDDGPGEPPVADDPLTSTEPFPGGRWESWHGVTVRVPADWQYGDLATWCADGGSEKEFRVGRPGGFVSAIACTPGSSYGVTFQDIETTETDEPFGWPVALQTGDAWPPGTFVGARGEEGVLVTVAGPDRDEVAAVLATVQAFSDTDPNGCNPRVGDDGLRVVYGERTMAVCRYDTSGLLEQSELLTGSDAVDAAAALDDTVDGDLDCQPADGPGATIEMFDMEHDVSIELDGACTVVEGWPDGIATPDVMWWALSPGWTGDATGLPIGSVLRSYDPAAR